MHQRLAKIIIFISLTLFEWELDWREKNQITGRQKFFIRMPRNIESPVLSSLSSTRQNQQINKQKLSTNGAYWATLRSSMFIGNSEIYVKKNTTLWCASIRFESWVTNISSIMNFNIWKLDSASRLLTGVSPKRGWLKFERKFIKNDCN